MKIALIMVMVSMVCSAFIVGHVKEAKKENELKNRDTIELDEEELKSCDEVSTRLVQGSELEVKAPGIFKSFMDGSCITDDTSEAYWQIMKMYPDENGIYSEGPYKGIAMAAYYGHVGDKFRVTLDSGEVFLAVMTDIKQEAHIDSTLADKINGSVIEFVVATEWLPEEVKLTGSLDCIYHGEILKIEKLYS